jgi:YHS domain-containing protein
MKILALVLGIILGSGLVFTQQTQAEDSIQAAAPQPVEVGNKTCPISGRTIGEMGPPYKEQYKGKVYNLCCGGCVATFESDPEKYSKIADQDAAQNGQYQPQ